MQEVQRYRAPTRILHWVHTSAFIILFLTGLALFVPPLSVLAVGGWTRLIHRVAAVLFVVPPVIYLLFNWSASWRSVKEAFTWGAEDLGWLQAAPRYYFLGDEGAMPPQGHMNSGQKLWWFMVVVFSVIFAITGFAMWALKTAAPSEMLQWAVFVHDVAFIATGAMLFVHIYLSVLHPMMSESWGSMTRGTVSSEYAMSHHGRWYAEMSKDSKPDVKVKVS